jgi:putative FmdB family regulatory protein
MPIYAYKCASCGHAKDVLQKISDEPLSVCPACGAATFNKQVTAAGFQLKGSGWYATDFRGSGAAPAPSTDKADAAKPADAAKTDTSAKPADTASTPPKNDTPSASAGGCGAGCSGH